MTKGQWASSFSYRSKTFLGMRAVPREVVFSTTPIFASTCNFSDYFSTFFCHRAKSANNNRNHIYRSHLADPTNFSFLFSFLTCFKTSVSLVNTTRPPKSVLISFNQCASTLMFLLHTPYITPTPFTFSSVGALRYVFSAHR